MANAFVRLAGRGFSQLSKQLAGVDRGLAKMGKTGGRTTRILSTRLATLSVGAKRLTALIGGAGVVAGARRILKFDDALGQLQADAGLSTSHMRTLRAEILQNAKTTGVAKEKTLELLLAMQAAGGVVKADTDHMKQLNVFMKATGTSGDATGKVWKVLTEKMRKTPGEALDFLAKFVAQANAGEIQVRNFAKVMPELASRGRLVGIGLDEVSLSVQTIGSVVGDNAEIARTSFNAMLRSLVAFDNKSKKFRKRFGLDKLFDPETGKLKDSLSETMRKIVVATKGQLGGKTGLSQIFTEEAQTAALAYAGAIDVVTGQFKTKAQGGIVAKVRGAGVGVGRKQIEEQFAIRVGGIAKESEKVTRAFAGLDQIVQTVGKRLIGFAAESPGTTAALAGTAYLGVKLAPLLGRMLTGAGKAGGVAGALGGAGVQPVFVVNLAGARLGSAAGFFGPGGQNLPGGPGGKPRMSIGQKIGAVGAVAGALGTGFQVGQLLDKWLDISGKVAEHQMAPLRKLSALRVKAHGEAIKPEAMLRLARELVAARKKGATTFGKEGGPRTALTAENVRALVLATAEKRGVEIKGTRFEALLSQILAEMKKAPILRKDGLSDPGTDGSRGKS